MSTHSPSTIAMSPQESIFEMRRTLPRVIRSKSKESTIGLLTAGLVTVSKSSRFVLVEDDADVDFYGAVQNILTDYGPSKDPMALEPSPSLVFLPASRGVGPGKTGGGSTVVTQWVNKFDLPPLKEIIRGITDRDATNQATDRILVLDRYSIENYLLDPLVVYARLIDEGAAFPIAGLTSTRGNEHLLRAASADILQAIVDGVASTVAPHLKSRKRPVWALS